MFSSTLRTLVAPAPQSFTCALLVAAHHPTDTSMKTRPFTFWRETSSSFTKGSGIRWPWVKQCLGDAEAFTHFVTQAALRGAC